MQDQTLTILQQLGFSAYESKAYVALLEAQPTGAYELSKRSGVPSSKIYETLNKLLRRNVIQFADENVADNPSYVALRPKDLMDRLSHEVKQQTEALLPLLDAAMTPVTTDVIWPLAHVDEFHGRTRSLIQSAQKSILISCWPEEVGRFMEDLMNAEKRNIRIALVHFGEPKEQIGATYHHPVEQTLYAEKGGRGFTLVVDSEAVVIANIGKTFDASWSRNQAFVTVAEDYVKHDVYITKVTRFLNEPLTQRFGVAYEKLRNIFDPEA